MDCKRVEEGVVVVLEDKKALLSFLVRDVDMKREIRRMEENSAADNTFYFHTHTHTFWFFTYLANRDIPFTCIEFTSRISE